MKNLPLILLLVVVLAIPAFAQTDSANSWAFGGVRVDNEAVIVSAGVLFDNVELVPGLVDVDIGPLSSIWYTDVFSTLWKSQPEKTSSIAFELAVKTQLLTERLTGGLTLGTSYEQQEESEIDQVPRTVVDYLAAATGVFAAYNVAKDGSRPWGPWAYAKYKSGIDNNFTDGWQAGIGVFYQLKL